MSCTDVRNPRQVKQSSGASVESCRVVLEDRFREMHTKALPHQLQARIET